MLKKSIAASALFFASCASTDLGPREVNHVIKKAYSVEADLDYDARKTEKRLKNSASIIRDPALNQYLSGMVNKVAGEYTGQLRMYAIEAPVFNAGIYPNGAMFVYSGLMLRAENEAELALVLGHEFGHFKEQHVLERKAAAKNAMIGKGLFSIATQGLGDPLGSLFVMSQFSNFNQKQELEADEVGIERIVGTGYSPHDAINLWKNMSAEKAASTKPKKSKKSKSSLFSTHPAPAERIKKLEALVDDLPRSDKTERERYRAVIRPFLGRWLAAELLTKDYGSTLFLVDRLGQNGEDLGVLKYIEGQTYMLRNGAGDKARALEAFKAAAQYGDAPAGTRTAIARLSTS